MPSTVRSAASYRGMPLAMRRSAPRAVKRPVSDGLALMTHAGALLASASADAASMSTRSMIATFPLARVRARTRGSRPSRTVPEMVLFFAEGLRGVILSWCHASALKQLKRVGACRCRVLLTRQQPGNLPHSVLTGHFIDLRHRDRSVRRLLDHHVPIGVRGDLRKMRHDNHLMRPRERGKALADGLGGLSTDSRIYLVEHEGVALISVPGQGHFHGKHDAGK